MSEIYTDSLTAFLQDTPFVFPVSAYIEYENNCAQQQIEIPGRDIGTGSIVYPCRHGCAQRNSCHISCIAYPVYGRKFPCTKKTCHQTGGRYGLDGIGKAKRSGKQIWYARQICHEQKSQGSCQRQTYVNGGSLYPQTVIESSQYDFACHQNSHGQGIYTRCILLPVSHICKICYHMLLNPHSH